MSLSYLFKSIIIYIFISFSLFAQNAKISIQDKNILTYPYSDPSPIAKINNIYPYFRFDGFSRNGSQQIWKMIVLENPYIKVLVAPEIGGKVWGAYDKSNGQAFIYNNNVVKFRDIAMRGPWTSGGIEFNFGDIGHAPSTACPVDYLIRENKDGSVSCFVGSIDLASRTEWRVEIRLEKDKSYFETKSFWYNPTPFSTSLYNWTTAAADAGDSLHYFFPGANYIDHDGGAKDWPMLTPDRDISYYRNSNYGGAHSYHVLGEYTDFFGGLYEANKTGFGHWALYSEKPGKKIWIWGLSRQGDIWESILTNPDLGNKQYTEIQTGLFYSQAAASSTYTPFKHSFFLPGSDERFSESWFPVKNIKNIADANKTGTLGVFRNGNSLEIGISANSVIKDTLVVRINNTVAYNKLISLAPLNSFSDKINLTESGKIEVVLGNNLLKYSNVEDKILSRRVELNKEFDWKSLEGLYTEGIERARQRDYEVALGKFLQCLDIEAVYSPALIGAAEMYCRKQEYQVAQVFILKALQNDTYDPDANYIYGLISMRLNKLYDAKDAFTFAARSMKYKSAAFLQLAEIYFSEKDYQAAEGYALSSIDYNKYNIQAMKLLAVIKRMEKKNDEAISTLNSILDIDPLNHFAQYEKYLFSKNQNDYTEFRSAIKTELASESVLEIAVFYYDLGLYNDAIALLEKEKSNAMNEYWLAYCYSAKEDKLKAKEHLVSAVKFSPYLVFPFREEEVKLFTWAVDSDDSWKNKYYLGLLYLHFGSKYQAEKYFNECKNIPDYAPFYLSRISLFEQTDTVKTITDYKTAIKLDPSSWRSYHLFNNYLIEKNKLSEALGLITEAANQFKSSYIIQFDLARTLLYNRKFDKCIPMLDTLVILPFEGASYGRAVYREAMVLQAIEKYKSGKYSDAVKYAERAKEWPERLGSGKPYDPDQRIEEYIQALCYLKLNKGKEYQKMLESIINYTEAKTGQLNNSGLLISAYALKDSALKQKGIDLLYNWYNINKAPASEWAVSIFNGKEEAANNVLLNAAGPDYNKLWNPLPGDGDFKLVKELIETINTK